MQRVSFLRASVLVALACCGCALVPYQPVVVPVATRPNIYDSLFMASIMVCQRRGWTVQTDATERTIEASPIGQGSYFISYRIRIDDGPRLRISASCADCGEGIRPDGTMQQQRTLVEEILAKGRTM